MTTRTHLKGKIKFCYCFLEFDWLIGWCLMSSGNIFMHIQAESMLMMSDDEWTLLYTRPTRWDGFFNVLAYEINRPQEDMPLYPDTGRPVFALTPKCCVVSGEAANTNLNVFGSTRLGGIWRERQHSIYFCKIIFIMNTMVFCTFAKTLIIESKKKNRFNVICKK